MTNGPHDILVVGAGPTGLSLAAQLAEFGVASRVIDRGQDRVHESRALAIQPRTLEVLAGLGVTGQLVANGNPAAQLRLHVRGRELAVPLFDLGLDDTAYPYLLFLSQAETERILEVHLTAAGVTVERGVELVDLTTTADAVVAMLRHRDGQEESVSARYVVGCDGAHSTVRRAGGIAFTGGAYPQTFILADAEADGIKPGAAHVFLSGNGMLFFFPLGKPATWRLLAMRPPTDPTPPEAPVTLDEVQAIADAYTHASVRLRDPVWRTYFGLQHRHATRYQAGRIFVAGDAAHVHSPAGAQGMNTGIQDAWNLGWKLALVSRGVADEALLESYNAERRPVGGFVVRFTDRAFSAATSTNPLIRALRTQLVPRVLPLALRFDRAVAYGFRTISQLNINYRHSPAAQEGHPTLRRGPRAGDRLPDARITRDGQECWLGEALAAPRFQLLLCGQVGDWHVSQLTALRHRYPDTLAVHHLTREATPNALHDLEGQVFARLGIDGTGHYLIRPDGHIGYRCGGDDLAGLQRYLARWLPNSTSRPA